MLRSHLDVLRRGLLKMAEWLVISLCHDHFPAIQVMVEALKGKHYAQAFFLDLCVVLLHQR